jgi:two-component system response regulator DctR
MINNEKTLKLDPIVYIINRNPIVLESLAWVVNTVGLKIKTFTHPQAFLDAYDPNQPGCLLVNIDLPEMSGPALHNLLKKKYNHIPPIIFISDIDDIAMAVSVMKEGAFDFMTKPLNEQMLLDAINHALHLDKEERNNTYEINQAKSKFMNLSPREKQILHQIIAGKSSKAISAEIQISAKTVEAHRASMKKKIGVKSTSELMKLFFCVEAGSFNIMNWKL